MAPPRSISVFPTEVLEAVLIHLSWRDLLKLRATCKPFYHASKLLNVWRAQLTRLSDSYTVPIIPPRPLDSYTSQDLERLVTRWLKAEFIWNPYNQLKQPDLRRIRQAGNEFPFPRIALVEGGRWLLSNLEADCGNIYASNLESEAMDSRVLIENSVSSSIAEIYTDLDHSSQPVAIHLAISYVFYEGVFSPGRVEIWRVIETLGPDASLHLSASRTNTFSTGVLVDTKHISSFFGSLYACFVDVACTQIEVYNWRYSFTNRPKKSTLSIDPKYRATSLKLLADGNLLVYGQHSICVLSVPETSYDVSDSDSHSYTPLLNNPLYEWTLGDEGEIITGSAASSTMVATGRTYLNIATSRGIYSLSMEDAFLSVTALITYDSPPTVFALGMHRAVSFSSRSLDSNILGLYSLRAKDQTAIVKIDWDFDEWESILIDEWTGRMVVFPVLNEAFILLHFVR